MPASLALFVAYLFDNKYASSTVNTYVSALGYYHRLAGLRDLTKTFYIRKILKGYGKISHKLDTRLPITLPILVRMMQASTIFVFLSINHICLKQCVPWRFLHSFVLVKSQCQSNKVPVVTFTIRSSFQAMLWVWQCGFFGYYIHQL